MNNIILSIYNIKESKQQTTSSDLVTTQQKLFKEHVILAQS